MDKILLICLEGKTPKTEEAFFKPVIDNQDIGMLCLDPCSEKNYNEALWKKLISDKLGQLMDILFISFMF